MTHVTFLSASGATVLSVDAAAGTRLLDLAHAHNLPLEGTCEGAMACSTCHVLVAAQDFGKLPKASVHEEDMLDFAAHVGPTSRLACQIWLADDLESLTLHLPAGHTNMQGR
jgi:ferredoxin